MNFRIENAFQTTRRGFLKGGAGLALAIVAPTVALAEVGGPGHAGSAMVDGEFSPNAFLRISTDGTVTVVSKHLEMGQGVYTGLATLVAEELDADWSRVTVEGAPADAKRYSNLFWKAQGTGGSTAIANSYEQMRRAGATARAMLVSAAAQQWKVPASQITVKNGVVSHAASGRKAGFGELAEAAAQLPVPANVKLKNPKDFTLIGRSAPRVDSVAKTTGRATFTQDVKLPGMLVAVVAHPPRFGGRVKSVDDKAARAIKGVSDVVVIPNGVAVLASDYWTAKKGRDALKVEWDEAQAYRGSSDAIVADYRERAKTPGLNARNDGNAEAALAKAGKVIEAEYVFPYLAHASMEPLNCVIKLENGECEVWNGEQLHTVDQFSLAKTLGIEADRVKLNMVYAGGSFGRRANPQSDYLLETAQIVKAINGRAPVKLVWSREDDMRGGFYRPIYLHRVRAALDAKGMPVAWQQRIVGQSIIAGSPFEPMLVKDGVDITSVEGASTLPYAIPNLNVDLHTTNADVKVPVQWWRSVGSTHTAYATELFIDELAQAAGKDPVAYRMALLKKHPRHAGVLKLAADKAGWNKPLAPAADGATRGRGVAVHESFNSFVAEVVEVTVQKDGSFKVDRVVCAVDCGVVVNPDVVRAQMEGGIGYALAAALTGSITLKDGVVEQSNFNDYPVLRINEMPRVEVHIVKSAAAPTGVGEPGVPPLAPALASALRAATGKVIHTLPIGEQLQA
ncbi:MAG: xanthine dehydrogenase family protein molybdopterin-binding subunit [Methyloversatilis sp.]|jgi:isoquinoline 1-oxidoreductase beta subunit|uniref:xanthine dehydrogenase family protein molybdopterin-binding subunit n=1 Tax=Methyloversatilis sp. TaxID=2569862 RepID=UPI0025DC78B4|nr:xanthine dehydrogenase family protein molybdopterin-binding subunit [Methyloversatilis sp.]MCR6668322.1 xanthine dehydrogenase family protein molybdopterin-binding subunit [Methyloversatilis sp.]